MSMHMNDVIVLQRQRLVAIGVNEALFLARLEYWLDQNKGNPEFQRDGCTWCRKSYAEWQQDLPFVSAITVRRVIAALEAQGLIQSTSAYRRDSSEAKWYTVNQANQARLAALEQVFDRSAADWIAE